MSQMISRRSAGIQIHSRSEPAGLLLEFLQALLGPMRQAWQSRADRKLLAELSDHQLRDIGIRREHISHVGRRGWDI